MPGDIGTNAFANCTGLQTLAFLEGVGTIESSAFTNCSSLTSLSLPNVSNIRSNAFENCTSLTNVTIGNTITNIDPFAFEFCSSLANITVPGNGSSYTPGPGIPRPYDDIFFLDPVTSINVTPGSTVISSNAFYDVQGVANVTIPFGVTNIQFRAFYDCPNLSSVTIPNSVSTIGTSAFANCPNLSSVTIPNSVTTIGTSAFANCLFSSITIPAGATNIGTNAFFGCASLAQVYFQGNAPDAGTNTTVFSGVAAGAVVYYLPGTTGWGPIYDGLPTALWNPQGTAFGVTGGQFGFTITGPTNATLVVEACTNLVNPIWTPVSTNTLSASGNSPFGDAQGAGSSMRFYRFRSP